MTASRRPRWRTARRPATSSAHAREARAAREPCARRPGDAMTLDLLRFTTAGSVDDGKSTLIGRLLYDSKQVFEDQLEHVAQASRRRGGEGTLDLALLTDGLRAEREQGITIDVAYRYFATAKRRFIIADCPGHQQYTRNMVTGASTADLSVVLLDARQRRARAVKAPRLHQRAARHPPAGRGGQQDGPGRATRASASRSWSRSSRASPRSCRRQPDIDLHPDVGARRRQRRRALGSDALVRRPDAAGPCWRGGGGLRPSRRDARRASPCSG